MDTNKLIFVYNADSGVFNTIADIAHKITSPETYQCQLCALTHGYFTIRNQWDQYLKQASVDFRFFHRDEFQQKYGDLGYALPAIFIEKDDAPQLLIDRDRIEQLQDVEELIALIQSL